MKFRWDDREIEMVNQPMFAETAAVERQAKMSYGQLTNSEQTAALLLISLRRAGVALTWSDILELSPDDFEVVIEPEPVVEEVPQPAGDEAGI